MAQFDDGKDAGALRSIGEVSAATGIKPHVLRYWEAQFDALRPLKRAGGRRLYRPEDVATVERIDHMVNREGYTLKGAKAALKAGLPLADHAPAAPARQNPDENALLLKLKAIRAELAQALAA